MAEVLGAVGIALVVILVPGLLLGYATGLRGWLLVGAAPVLTAGVIGVAGPLLPLLGIRWGPLSFLVATVVLAAVGHGLRTVLRRYTPARLQPRLTPPPPPWRVAHHVGVAASVVASTVVGLVVSLNASRALTAIPQWHDVTHHANGVRYIADTGDTAIASLAVLVGPGAEPYFYPNGYYVLSATVRQLGGLGVVPTLDVVNALLVGVVALGLVCLVKAFAGGPALCVVTGIVACAVPMFPYEVLVWGPLFPFTAGVALLPAGVALAGSVWRSADVGLIPAAAVGLVGLAIVHVSAGVAAAALIALLLVQRWATGPRSILADVTSLLGLGIVALMSGALFVSDLLNSAAVAGTAGIDWPEEGTASWALGKFVTATRDEPQRLWWLFAMLVIGACFVWRRRFRPLHWWMAGGVLFLGVYVLTASTTSPIQRLLAGPWSDDPYRLAAVAVPGLVVLLAVGIVGLRDLLAALLRPLTRRIPTSLVGGALLAVVVVATVAATGGLVAKRNTSDLSRLYPDGPIVSTAKVEAMAWVAGRLPPGTTLANDALDGSPWIWALDGVVPMLRSASAGRPTGDSDPAVVIRELNRLDSDPRVQQAVRDLRISYVFISQGWVVPGATLAPGFRGLDQVRGLQPVYDVGGVQIYAVRDPAPSGVGAEQP